jgi:hypothetical protein
LCKKHGQLKIKKAEVLLSSIGNFAALNCFMHLPSFLWLWKIAAWSMGLSLLVQLGGNKATIFNRQKAYCILVLTFDF